jgi:hypothetical protein
MQGNSYNGTLTLAFDQNKRIMARWIINHDQIQGTGFLEIIFLVINFNYEGEGQ